MTTRPFLPVFGITDAEGMVAGQPVNMSQVAVEAAKQGYAVVALRPGTKVPDLCTYTAAEKKADPNHKAENRCGVGHFTTDPKKARSVFDRMQRPYDVPLNMGVIAGPSRIIHVDADTAEAVKAFQNVWAESTGDPGYLGYSPTVLTPGAFRDGEWKHSDGGHFYFNAPEGFDWTACRTTSLKAPGGFDVRWGMQMSVVPPSVREEGRYRPLSDVQDAPEFLMELIEAAEVRASASAAKLAEYIAEGRIDADVAAWSAATPWVDLLVEDDWADTSKLDGCGCPIFEKPGGGSTTYKSATGHENTCSHYPNIEGHGPLHLWTTEPPPPLDEYIVEHGQTITKLHYVALTRFNGDVSMAKEGLGITLSSDALDQWLGIRGDSWDSSPEPSPSPESQDPEISNPESPALGSGIQGLGDSDPEEPQEDPVHESPDESPMAQFWLPGEDSAVQKVIKNRAKEIFLNRRASEYLDFTMASSIGTESMSVIAFGTREARIVDPDVGHREDGVPMLYRGRVNTIFGPSEAGKSWYGIYCISDVISRGGRVLFIDVEDDYDGFDLRINEVGVKATAENCTYVRLWAPPDQAGRMTLLNHAKGCDLVVVDSFDGLLGIMAMDSNHATSIRSANSLLKQIAVQSNAALLLVDHTSEKNDSNQQLGSSAKKQVVDGASYRAEPRGRWKKGVESRTLILAGKDRHGFAKANAVFENEGDEWGRMGLLRIMPGWPDQEGFTLDMLRPPSFDEDPSISASALTEVEDAVIEFLRKTPGEWKTRTQCCSAGGDKSNRSGLQQRALDGLVEAHVIEHHEIPIRGGKTGIEYRYVDLD